MHLQNFGRQTLVHPAVHAGRFLSLPVSISRDGRKQAILVEELLCMEGERNPGEERGLQSQARWEGQGEGQCRGHHSQLHHSGGHVCHGMASWSLCGSSVLPVVMT